MGTSEIIALVALIFSGITVIRAFGKDSKSNNTELTTVIVKLENIGGDIAEIKKDIRSVKSDLREHGERITRAEQKIEAIEKTINIYHHCDISEE